MKPKAAKEKIGLYGGTFDPIHLGHLLIAEDALRFASLDRLVFLPAFSSPLRKNNSTTPPETRLEMVRRAVEGFPDFTVDDFDVRQGRRVYTTETVEYFREKFPDAELYFIIGFDQLAQLEDWHDIENLRKRVTFLCAQRGDEEHEAHAGEGVVLLSPRRIDISATEVRNRVANGESVRSLVPVSVAHYLEDHSLYRRG